MARFRQLNIHDYWRHIGAVLLLAGGIVFAFTVLVERTPVVFVILFFLALFWAIVAMFSRNYGYQCQSCKKVFRVPTTVNFFTPSGIGRNPDGTYYSWKSLTCPHCGARTKAKVLKKADLRGSQVLINERKTRQKRGGAQPQTVAATTGGSRSGAKRSGPKPKRGGPQPRKKRR